MATRDNRAGCSRWRRAKRMAPNAQHQNSIDLTALGVSPGAPKCSSRAERRVAKTMRNLPGIGISLNSGGGLRRTFPDGLEGVNQGLAAGQDAGGALESSHYFIRTIQEEQLLEQDLMLI